MGNTKVNETDESPSTPSQALRSLRLSPNVPLPTTGLGTIFSDFFREMSGSDCGLEWRVLEIEASGQLEGEELDIDSVEPCQINPVFSSISYSSSRPSGSFTLPLDI